jgi:hypothetical protein
MTDPNHMKLAEDQYQQEPNKSYVTAITATGHQS